LRKDVHDERSSRDAQNELDQQVRERLAIINSQIASAQEQLNRLLDLYLRGDSAKDMLSERKERLEKTINNQTVEKAQTQAQLKGTRITDEQTEDY